MGVGSMTRAARDRQTGEQAHEQNPDTPRVDRHGNHLQSPRWSGGSVTRRFQGVNPTAEDRLHPSELSDRFLLEATISVSDRFLLEATGPCSPATLDIP